MELSTKTMLDTFNNSEEQVELTSGNANNLCCSGSVVTWQMNSGENKKSSAKRKKLLLARWCRSSLIQLHQFKSPATVLQSPATVQSGCLSVASVVMVLDKAETLQCIAACLVLNI